jgi:hypothetical protein
VELIVNNLMDTITLTATQTGVSTFCIIRGGDCPGFEKLSESLHRWSARQEIYQVELNEERLKQYN